MAIQSFCESCGRTLRVGDEFAGKQARCPVCNHLYTVPSGAESSASGSEAETARWLLKTPEGAVYGPVTRMALDQWLAEGRIASDCYLAEGNSGSWQPAAKIYPQLASSAGSAVPPNPFSSAPRTSTVGYQGAGGDTYLRPHRGGLILALGLIGLMSCAVVGIMAWVMGSEDLREIRAGRMDPSGEGLTQAGTVLGMISAILVAVSLVGVVVFLLFFAALAAVA